MNRKLLFRLLVVMILVVTLHPLSAQESLFKAYWHIENNDTHPYRLAHGCWDEALTTPGIFKWLFGKKKQVCP